MLKKIIVIGASGSLAQYVIDSLEGLGNVSLTLFVRNKNKLSKCTAEGCMVIEGDAMNYSDVKNAIQSQEIVYINLSGNLEIMAKKHCKSNAGSRRKKSDCH